MNGRGLCAVAVLVPVWGCGDIGRGNSTEAGEPALEITLDYEVTLGRLEDPASPTNLARVAWWEGVGWAVAPVYQAGVVNLYDEAGRWSGTVGALGEGPGELPDAPGYVLYPFGDSLWVNPVPERTVTIFPPGGGQAASVSLPSALIGFPITHDHMLYAIPSQDDSVFLGDRQGDRVGAVAFPRPPDEVGVFGGAPDGAWIARRDPYTLVKVDREGTPVRRIEREPPWVSDLVDEGSRVGVYGLWEDEAGLWVVMRVREEEPETAAEEGLVHRGDWDPLSDTLIELLDPVTGRSRALLRDERALHQVQGRAVLSQIVDTDLGDNAIRLYRLGTRDVVR